MKLLLHPLTIPLIFKQLKHVEQTLFFVEIEEETLCIDVRKVESFITPKTKCIIAMDYGANLCDHKRLREISCKYNIPIIHDAAFICIKI